MYLCIDWGSIAYHVVSMSISLPRSISIPPIIVHYYGSGIVLNVSSRHRKASFSTIYTYWTLNRPKPLISGRM